MKILNEFKDFAMKGNVVDMGVGIVIGAAFTSIVNSFVKDIINPPIGLITGSVDFSDKMIVLKEATDQAAAVTLNYGSFITALINFIIVAFVIFIIIKQVNRLKAELEEKEKNMEEEKKSGPTEIELLTEIRDSLKK